MAQRADIDYLVKRVLEGGIITPNEESEIAYSIIGNLWFELGQLFAFLATCDDENAVNKVALVVVEICRQMPNEHFSKAVKLTLGDWRDSPAAAIREYAERDLTIVANADILAVNCGKVLGHVARGSRRNDQCDGREQLSQADLF